MAVKRKRKRLTASKWKACKPGKQGPCDFEAATWNLGGMAAEKICDIVRLFDDLGQGKVGILAMQEVTTEEGVHRYTVSTRSGQALPGQHRRSGDGRSRHRICSARSSRQNWCSGLSPSPESNPGLGCLQCRLPALLAHLSKE